MPRVSRASFTVHDHETNAWGEAFSSSLARFLQQAAIDASAEAGFSDAWYRRAGTVWVVHRSTIERRGPVCSGDRLDTTTWVADFRRVRSRREYEVRRSPGAEPVVVAGTDWVYVDRSSGKLARVPDEMIRGFVPEGNAKTLPRKPLDFPPAPDRAPAAERIVRFRAIDGMFHVNNAVYLDYFEDTFVEMLASRGWTPERCIAEGGFLRPALHDVEYLDEAHLGDRLSVRAWPGAEPGEWLTEVRRAGDGVLLTHARSRWVWVSADQREPAPPPAGLEAALRTTS